MAKGRTRKNGKRTKSEALFVRPTVERELRNDWRSAGTAKRTIPPIETLYANAFLTERQFLALDRYATVAIAAERSEVKSNIDFTVYGQGEGLPHFGVRMRIELGFLERELGSLRDLTHSVCVNEMTLSRVAMHRFGAIERFRTNSKGEIVARWMEPPKQGLAVCGLELRVAAERLAAAIAA